MIPNVTISENRLKDAAVLDFILAGKAIFTVRNTETMNRFTYKVRASKDGKVYFVSVLTGTDNNTNYSYIGTIFDKTRFVHTSKSKIKKDATSVLGFTYLFRHLLKKDLDPCYTFYHEGRCGRCGRRLTDPESIESGYGPECINLKRK